MNFIVNITDQLMPSVFIFLISLLIQCLIQFIDDIFPAWRDILLSWYFDWIIKNLIKDELQEKILYIIIITNS